MARSVLLDNLPHLRDRLEEQGMRVLKFTVDVGQQDIGDGRQQSDFRGPTTIAPKGKRRRAWLLEHPPTNRCPAHPSN